MKPKTNGIIKALKSHSKETGTKPFTTQIQYKELDPNAYYEYTNTTVLIRFDSSVFNTKENIKLFSDSNCKIFPTTDNLFLKLTDDNNIDIIIKYYPNRSIDTNDLYGIINDLNDDGKEVIALILDYVKRIKPSERASSEKEELKNITNELKNLATYYDIPVNGANSGIMKIMKTYLIAGNSR